MQECPTCGQGISDQLAICPYCAATVTSPSEHLTPRSAADRAVRREESPALAEGRLYTPLEIHQTAAGLGIRITAALLDLAALAMAGAALALIAFFLTSTAGGKGLYGALTNAVCGLLFIGLCLYNTVYLPGVRGASVGKRLCGIVVVNEEGAFLGLWRTVFREWGKCLSLMPFGLGLLWAAWDPQHQTWHDKLVGSFVQVE